MSMKAAPGCRPRSLKREIRRKKASASSIADFERNVIQPDEPLATPRLRQSLGS
jgi:hypothetical protein